MTTSTSFLPSGTPESYYSPTITRFRTTSASEAFMPVYECNTRMDIQGGANSFIE